MSGGSTGKNKHKSLKSLKFSGLCKRANVNLLRFLRNKKEENSCKRSVFTVKQISLSKV
jgi:hypothetical protein